MPSAKKVAWSQLKVGITAAVAMVILGALVFLLTGSTGLFEKNVRIRTYMDDASGTGKNAPVRLNGINIGNVEDIRLSGSNDPKRAVEFVLSVQDKFLPDIPDDSTAAINAASLLGDKFINITKGPNRHGRHVQPGGELASLQVQDIPELMAQTTNLLTTMQDILKRLDSMIGDIDQGKGNIGKLIKDEELYNRLNAIAAEGQKIMTDVRTGKGTISKLLYDDTLYNDLRAPIQRLDALLAELQQSNGTAGRLLHDPKLYDEAQATIAEIRRVVAGINTGQGTAGKLLKDDKLYAGLNQLIGKIDQTVDRMSSGQGTVGQLMVNPQLYEAMNGAMREFQSLAKDIRANPKKFLSIKLGLF